MGRFAHFGTIYTILKTRKAPTEECYLTKSNTPLWMLFTFFVKLYKCYQIAQSITNACFSSLIPSFKKYEIEITMIYEESHGFLIYLLLE